MNTHRETCPGELECRAIIVLGHPECYPRFGFVPASRSGIRSEYDVPDNVFMALELEDRALAGKQASSVIIPRSDPCSRAAMRMPQR